MTTKRALLASLLLALAAPLVAAPASAQTKWNLPAAYPASNYHSENLIQFAKDVEAATATMDERLKALASRLGLETIDPLDYVCDRTTCPAIDGDGDPIYLDISHLRASTA